MILENLEESIVITSPNNMEFVNDHFLDQFQDAIKNYCVNKPAQDGGDENVQVSRML